MIQNSSFNVLRRLGKAFAIETEGLLLHPYPIIPLLNRIQRSHPVLSCGGYILITKYADAREVLEDDACFAQPYVKAGPDQIVALPRGPEFDSRLSAMNDAVNPNLVAVTPQIAQGWASNLVRDAGTGPIDAVSQFSRLIPRDLIESFLGLTPFTREALTWTRSIFRDVFTNLTNNSMLGDEAIEARTNLNRLIEALIAKHRGGSPASGVLGSMLTNAAAQPSGAPWPLSDINVRNIIGGLACAMADTISSAIAHTLDYLLDHRGAMEGAADAARENNPSLLLQYVLEALRFSPEIPVMMRICVKNRIIAPMTPRATLIPGGATVVIATSSAMFDPDQFKDPYAFKINRPKNDYLHFGMGLHRCFGEMIAGTIVPAAVGELLLRNVRRVPGCGGRMRYDGAFPRRFMVCLDS
jgi:cytochrome P450